MVQPNLVAVVFRHWEDWNQSTGSLVVYDMNDNCQPIFLSAVIERGDRNNEQNVSNVPPGEYDLVWEWSPKFNRMLWELKGVLNRSECKIHPSNYWDQLNGCFAPGSSLGDLDKDGYYDVLSSGDTVDRFHKAMKPMEAIGKTRILVIDPIGIF